MDPRVKQLWITALRSGEYVQGRHQLRICNTYCCLGVLCDLYAKEHPRANWGVGNTFVDAKGDSSSALLPNDVIEWAGLTSSNLLVKVNQELGWQLVSQLNDAHRFSFLEIADLIRDSL